MTKRQTSLSLTNRPRTNQHKPDHYMLKNTALNYLCWALFLFVFIAGSLANLGCGTGDPEVEGTIKFGNLRFFVAPGVVFTPPNNSIPFFPATRGTTNVGDAFL